MPGQLIFSNPVDIKEVEATRHDSDAKETRNVQDSDRNGKLLYRVDEYPPFLMSIFLAFQQVSLSIGGCMTASVIVSRIICVNQKIIQAKLLNTFMVITGISTFLQSTIGIRIPTIQSSSAAFLIVAESLFMGKYGACDVVNLAKNGTNVTEINENFIWNTRIREIQGAIILAGLTQIAIGFFGLVGFLMSFIGPITVSVTLMLVALQMAGFILHLCQKHWGVVFLTTGLILVFSSYLRNWSPKLPVYSRRKGCTSTRFPLHKVFSILIAVTLAWIICCVLTSSGALSSNPNDYSYNARTDITLGVLAESTWVYIPYPGQWGPPLFTLTGYIAMLIPTIVSILESIGDYHACAEACDLPPPPPHAINRGVFIEGIGSFLAGAYGGGGSVTSYSHNAGVISITKAASRFIYQMTALVFLIFGIIGKFGAALTAMPTPIVGGTLLASIAMIFGVALGNLSKVDTKSSRNQMVIGISVLVGVIVPMWVTRSTDMIKTGNMLCDELLKVLLNTTMIIGGFLSCLLDNTIPGTTLERGMVKWGKRNVKDSKGDNVYDFPYVMPWLRRQKWALYLPIMPVSKSKPEQEESKPTFI